MYVIFLILTEFRKDSLILGKSYRDWERTPPGTAPAFKPVITKELLYQVYSKKHIFYFL